MYMVLQILQEVDSVDDRRTGCALLQAGVAEEAFRRVSEAYQRLRSRQRAQQTGLPAIARDVYICIYIYLFLSLYPSVC